ncbi:MAG: hypothetical protein NUV84_01345 [Candidatus Uhrbacteria bacterium]|nr:hypothetical protein [Candidatus Uhrbacteria bacterium]
MDDKLCTYIGRILRTSPDRADAKFKIAERVKETLHPRPEDCVVAVVWSRDPGNRSATIYLEEGHKAFTVST